MMNKNLCGLGLLSAAILLAWPAVSGAADVDDIINGTAPQKWLKAIEPEDLPPVDVRPYDTPLDIARKQVYAGHYRAAIYRLYDIKQGDPATIALLRAQADLALGRYDNALAALDKAGPDSQGDIAVMRGRVLREMGRADEALKVLKQAVIDHAQLPAAHFELGQLAEELGDFPLAIASYGWFNDRPQAFFDRWMTSKDDPAFASAQQLITVGQALDRWATLTGAYKDNTRLHNEILAMFVRAYDVVERRYGPAHVAAAAFFLNHDDMENAVEELGAALEENPQSMPAMRLYGRMMIDNYNFDGGDKVIAAMRQVNPTSYQANLLETRNLLQQRQPAQAQAVVQKVLAVRPHDLEALGLLASCQALALKDDQLRQTLKQADEICPTSAVALFEVAEQLGNMRQYPRAAEMYQQAIQRAPWWNDARNGLGLLYTQSGDEDLARTVLEQAHAMDPFSMRTTNYLRLLDGLSKFSTSETEHFIVMYDSTVDPVIPEYFGRYLESIHQAVCATFKAEPTRKTLIEVFPTHAAFSVRTTGAPWIGTVGASTGRVIAMVSPRNGKNTMGAFNWAQVLRHEYTHTVTLAATDNRIAHWFTEGLAVQQERSPMQWEWVPMLYSAVNKHQLFRMNQLTWGFVRPRRPIDRQLAYAESSWVCQYIEEKYGHQTILDMMQAFKDGASELEVFPRVLHMSDEEFTEQFFAWTKQQVDTWGYDPETSEKYTALRTQAEQLTKSRQYDQAAVAWEQIVTLRPMDALPHQRLAGVYLAGKHPDKALEHLKILSKVEIRDNRYDKMAARICRDENDLTTAQQYALDAVYTDPYDLSAHQLLAEILEKIGPSEDLDREKRVIPILQKWLDDSKQKAIQPAVTVQ